MIVLGITDSITSGATLVADGKVLAAVSEERLNRQKMAMGFPKRSIDAVLKITGLEMRDVNHIAVATNSLFWRPEATALEDYFRKQKSDGRDILLFTGSFFAKWTGGNELSRKLYHQVKSALTRSRKKKIQQALAEYWRYAGEITFVDHHLAHCASAYFTSGMNDTVVVSLDGAGDGCSSHVYHVQDGNFRILNKIDSYDSIGNYYAYVTHLCGFKAHKHEGKITGLAAYGKGTYVDLLKKYVVYDQGRIKNTGNCFDRSAIAKIQKDLGDGFRKEDLAASIQFILEEVATQYVKYWVERIKTTNVALAGGVCANVKLNQRIHDLESVKSIFIHPGMGDEGLATGAALLRCFQLCKKTGIAFECDQIQDVYWGPEYSDTEIENILKKTDFFYECNKNIEPEIAKILADGKVVARFDGRMEYGPRALGNRSILYQAVDKTVNDWLNKRLHRTEFMPFAPVTLKEYVHDCYVGFEGAEVPAKFMAITFDCTDWMKKNCPAVVHIDGTARPQIIDKQTNPSYYMIIDEYRKLTGLSSIINTSFNMHEEPIVCSPSDALRAFLESKIDYLAIGRFLVRNTA